MYLSHLYKYTCRDMILSVIKLGIGRYFWFGQYRGLSVAYSLALCFTGWICDTRLKAFYIGTCVTNFWLYRFAQINGLIQTPLVQKLS